MANNFSPKIKLQLTRWQYPKLITFLITKLQYKMNQQKDSLVSDMWSIQQTGIEKEQYLQIFQWQVRLSILIWQHLQVIFCWDWFNSTKIIPENYTDDWPESCLDNCPENCSENCLVNCSDNWPDNWPESCPDNCPEDWFAENCPDSFLDNCPERRYR